MLREIGAAVPYALELSREGQGGRTQLCLLTGKHKLHRSLV